MRQSFEVTETLLFHFLNKANFPKQFKFTAKLSEVRGF